MHCRPRAEHRVLVIAPPTSYRPQAYIQAADRLGIELWLASDAPGALAALGRPVLHAPLSAPEATAAALVEQGPFSAVLGVDETTAVVAAYVARGLGLSHNPPEAVLATRDKALMRLCLARAGVRQPHAEFLAPELAHTELAHLALPCVVKPPMLSGSQGVIRADTADELERAIFRVRALLDRHPSPHRSDPGFRRLLLETYVDGPEIAIEGVLHEGRLEPLAIFDKPDPLVGPFFEETLYVTPSRLPDAAQRDALEVAEQAARALRLVEGPVHAELRIAEDGAHLIELAARSIGGLCSRALELKCGNLEELILRHALSLPRPARVPGAAAVGAMMIPIPKSGVLRRTQGIEAARAVAQVLDVVITARAGEALRALPEGSSYLGFIFASGGSPEDVEHALRTAHAELSFELSPLLNP